ncbi:serine/threonine-protein kinase [Thermincola potens]|uniref:non-specific serine/threonine protein kinase n=1 Tax=Thermincola potens (strain JR) TaxID=635013 RepID=D5XCN6_THEPJ|nr:serine/threonine-protein kinase [Thermincola potens]ADG81662.1 serine/threonine protein kinase [Thermincola potens JR]
MLKIGDLLEGKYKIIRLLGRGAWGSVYLAEHLKLGNHWAVKEIDLRKDTRVNLLAEPEILKKLNHRSLPRIIDIISFDNCIYIIEDYFEGTSLKELIGDRKFCTEENVIAWAKQLCEILIYLHGFNPPIIYRDMKPGNIIIDSEGNARLIDFGIAREYKQGQASDSTFIGTRGYAAPEQFSLGCQSDERTDIYGLGATLYHVLTGSSPNEPPYEMVPVRRLNRLLSKDIERIIQKCVQNDPAMRYQSAVELLEDLNKISSRQSNPLNSLFRGFAGQFNARARREIIVEKPFGTVVIAVGGTNRGVGCTHTAISISAFLAQMKYTVAAVELNDNPVFFTLQEKDTEGGLLPGAFRIAGVDFYKRNTDLIEVLRAGYNYVVLDLGQLIRYDKQGVMVKHSRYDEVDRADLAVLVAGSAIWQLKDLAPYLKDCSLVTWRLLFKLPDDMLFEELKKELPCKIYANPCAPDPFNFCEQRRELLSNMLSEVLPKEKRKNPLVFWR